MFEGKPVGTPDAGAFWRMVEQHRINVLFAAPTAFRAIRKEDPEANCIARYDLSSLRTIFMAGERLDPPTYHWTVEKPVSRWLITGGKLKPVGLFVQTLLALNRLALNRVHQAFLPQVLT